MKKLSNISSRKEDKINDAGDYSLMCVKDRFTFVYLHTWQGSEWGVKRRQVVEKGGGRGVSQGARQINFDGTLGSFPPSYRFHVKGKCLPLELISWLNMKTFGEYLWLRLYSISRNVRDSCESNGRCKNPYWFFF